MIGDRENKDGVVIAIGSKWELVRFQEGQLSPFKVMGFCGDWAMLRRKNAVPICAHINTFGKEYVAK